MGKTVSPGATLAGPGLEQRIHRSPGRQEPPPHGAVALDITESQAWEEEGLQNLSCGSPTSPLCPEFPFTSEYLLIRGARVFLRSQPHCVLTATQPGSCWC